MSIYDKIRSQLDIVEVISEYLPLKRVGNSYAARCPFHADKTPSFYVSPSKGIWKCFGCGKGGDVIKFVAEYENISYFEAAKVLAERYNIPVNFGTDESESKYIKALRLINNFYKENLLKVAEAKNYLLKVRKIPPSLVEEFEIGFCGDGFKSVEFAKKEGILEPLLELKHFFKTPQGSYKDFFYGRITIPIKNITSKIIAFGGRRLDENLQPKYKNSPNSVIFQKEKTLFGVDKAKEPAREKEFLIVVEGFFDIIRLHSVGIRNCVAPLGTSLTVHHARVIKKLAPKVVLLFDGDTAGRRAALEASKKLLQQDLEVFLAFLPEGEDPDSFVLNRGIKAIKELIASSEHIRDYLIKRAISAPSERVERIAKLYRELAEYLPDSIKRELWLKEFESKVGIPLKGRKKTFIKRLPPRDMDTAEIDFLLGLLYLEPTDIQLEDFHLSPKVKEIAENILSGHKDKLPKWLFELDTTDLKNRFETAKAKLFERKLHSEDLFKILYQLEERIKTGKATKEDLTKFKLLFGELNKVQKLLYRKFKESLKGKD